MVLLNKMEAAGKRGIPLKWIYYSLTGTSQQVRVGGHLSSPLPVKSQVPQGSFISLLLCS